MDKIAAAEKRNDKNAMRYYLKKAESCPIVVNFQKWLLDYSKNIFLLLHEDRADKDAAVQELLRLRKEAVRKPQKLEEFEHTFYRYVKWEYARLLLCIIQKYSDKTNILYEYEEICLELIEIMEKEQWGLMGEDADYYSCVYGMTADYYAHSGRAALAGVYYKKVWDKYKNAEFISEICFTVLCTYTKNLKIQGNNKDAVGVFNFLLDKLFDDKLVECGRIEMEPVIWNFFSRAASFIEITHNPKMILQYLDSVLDDAIFQAGKWNENRLDVYRLYLNELNDGKLPCPTERKLEIQHYLKQFKIRVNLDEKPAWVSLEYYMAKYFLCRLNEEQEAAAYLERCRQILLEERFLERDRFPFLAGMQFVTQEYIEIGDCGKACECVEYFMKKIMEFYSESEFYTDNESMEKYLEVCDMGFQYMYQAVGDFISKNRKLEYSLNYKRILSSILRLRNKISALGGNDMLRREKKPDALQYFTLRMLEDALPERTAVLDFLYLEPEIYETKQRILCDSSKAYRLDIFAVVKKDSGCVVEYKSVPEAERLNETVENLISKMKSGTGKMKKLSKEVYHELILEFEPVLEGTEHLWLCPDGILSNLSFDTLFELSGSMPDLCDFIYWQSLRDVFEGWQEYGWGMDKPDISFKSCMVGNPKFELNGIGKDSSGNEMRQWAQSQLIPLPYSGYEAKKLAEIMGGECFVGEKATKFVLRQGYRYIHIATHGFNLGGSENPWHNSMLAFSGSQDYLRSGRNTPGHGNGFLSAEEISRMDLRGTEIAVLSACGSGKSIFSLHKQQTGLHVAFGVAGVRYIISALWAVDDFPTAVLMNFFYENMKKGISISKALFVAKKQLQKMTVKELVALIRQDQELFFGSYDELLAEFEGLPSEFCYYSSMRYWGSFVCSQTMY